MPPESALPDLLPYKLETSSHYKDVNQSHETPKPVCKAGDPGEAALGVWQGLCPVVAAFCGVFVAGRMGGSPLRESPGCVLPKTRRAVALRRPFSPLSKILKWQKPGVHRGSSKMRKTQAPVRKLPAHSSRNILSVNLLLIIQGK